MIFLIKWKHSKPVNSYIVHFCFVKTYNYRNSALSRFPRCTRKQHSTRLKTRQDIRLLGAFGYIVENLHSGNFLHSVGTIGGSMWTHCGVVIFFTVLALCGSMWTHCGKFMPHSGNFVIVWTLCGSMWTHCGKFMPHSGNFLHIVDTMWINVNTLLQINVTEW